jgi:hypothetical protein
MSAIEASSAGVKDMADGSLRITVEFEPRFAKDAYALFGARGTPLAIAALKTGYAVAGEPSVKESLTPETPKGGALAKLAGMWCADKTFQAWLETDPDNAAPNESGATLCLYALCEIESRRELDHDPAAAERFNRLIRGPYMKWRASKGLL